MILALRRYTSTPYQMPPSVVAFLQRRGETLPECAPGYASEPEPDFSPAVKAAQAAYDKGIRAAVDARSTEQETCREVWQRARARDVVILPDGVEGELPTGGVKAYGMGSSTDKR